MSSSLIKMIQIIDFENENIIPYISTVLVMSVFVSLFLCAAYLSVNLLSYGKAELSQNGMAMGNALFWINTFYVEFMRRCCRIKCLCSGSQAGGWFAGG